jgi:hypothetical protein
MQNGQVIEQDVTVQIPLVLKVDKAKREVEGIATQEVKDVHGETVDHDSMKAVLADWPGNIREMHQPKAVGKAVKVVSDDDRKATIVRARISKGAEDTWEKVLDGTLSMFSIGGTGKRVTQKVNGKDETRIVMSALHEISVVDNGACPTAKFDIVKFVDGHSIETELAGGPDDETPAPITVAKARLLALVTQFAAAPKAKAAAEQLITKVAADAEALVIEKAGRPEPYDVETALSCIALLERLVTQEWWQRREQEAMGDDTSSQDAQLAVLQHAIQLVLAFLVSEIAAQFEAQPETATVANVRRAALVEDADKVAPWTFGRLDTTGQLWVAKAGARHSRTDVTMIQTMHDTAIALGALCASAHSADQATAKAAAPDAAPQGVAYAQPPVAEPTPAETPVVVSNVTDGQTLTVTSSEAPAPAHTEPVAKNEPAQPVAQPAAAAAPVVAEPTPLDAVQKLISDAVSQALATQKATHDTAIAELTTRIEKLAAEPLPGGPKARATSEATPVHKSLGGDAGPPAVTVDLAAVTTFATELAKDASTEEERLRIATNLVRFQHRTGQGGMAVSTGRPLR